MLVDEVGVAHCTTVGFSTSHSSETSGMTAPRLEAMTALHWVGSLDTHPKWRPSSILVFESHFLARHIPTSATLYHPVTSVNPLLLSQVCTAGSLYRSRGTHVAARQNQSVTCTPFQNATRPRIFLAASFGSA